MDYSEDQDETKISKINAAALINLTLKNLWDDFYLHFRKNKFSQANADLDCLWIEFGGEEKEGNETYQTFTKLDKEVSDNYLQIPTKKSGFDKKGKINSTVFGKQNKLLRKKALFLKKLQNNQGKGTAYQDNAADYMDS